MIRTARMDYWRRCFRVTLLHKLRNELARRRLAVVETFRERVMKRSLQWNADNARGWRTGGGSIGFWLGAAREKETWQIQDSMGRRCGEEMAGRGHTDGNGWIAKALRESSISVVTLSYKIPFQNLFSLLICGWSMSMVLFSFFRNSNIGCCEITRKSVNYEP